MEDDATWMGQPIDEMPPEELAAALKAAVHLLRSASPGTFIHPDVDVRVTPAGTIVARTFKWAFIPAGHLWSDEDRQVLQARLDAFAPRHGLQGALVRFGPDQLEVEVPRPLRIEQLVALQEWLNAEKDALDVSQVP
jgi:hypothetical protein